MKLVLSPVVDTIYPGFIYGTWEYNLNTEQALDAFFTREERPAFRIAEISTGSRDDALDIVQDAMIKFAEKYSRKDHSDWKPLFYRIVYSRITDWHRRRKVRTGVLSWFTREDELESVPTLIPDPESELKTGDAIDALESALHSLPLRQQQAVLHRLWEGMSTKETAVAMNVSTGSVKTHYSRGLKTLQNCLGEHWP